MPSTNEVFQAILSERAYQIKKWGSTGSSGTPGKGERTVDEFALYILEYATQLLHLAGTTGPPDDKLDAVRKVAALCIGCMEQHGAQHRL